MALFLLAASIFYLFEKHRIIDLQCEVLQKKSNAHIQRLRTLHQDHTLNKLAYPVSEGFHSAIFDIDQNFIFGDFKPPKFDFNTTCFAYGDDLYHVETVLPYYLGTAYLIVQQPLDNAPVVKLLQRLALFLVLVCLIFLIAGYYLGRLFIRPMRQSIEMIERFIEDSTHELNTPISTILTNIELLDTLYNCEGREERKRIEIASKTLSHLYDDLTYLKLNHRYHRNVISCDLSALLAERLCYFASMIEGKKITLQTEITPEVKRLMDQNDAQKLIDNLLSNAIKYNKKNGTLKLFLDTKQLVVKDSGIGMKEEETKKILERYHRACDGERGFGIGMDIVMRIVKHYGFKLSIFSQEGKGTQVSILWGK
jgi:two-component system OmpR family sensor kinase